MKQISLTLFLVLFMLHLIGQTESIENIGEFSGQYILLDNPPNTHRTLKSRIVKSDYEYYDDWPSWENECFEKELLTLIKGGVPKLIIDKQYVQYNEIENQLNNSDTLVFWDKDTYTEHIQITTSNMVENSDSIMVNQKVSYDYEKGIFYCNPLSVQFNFRGNQVLEALNQSSEFKTNTPFNDTEVTCIIRTMSSLTVTPGAKIIDLLYNAFHSNSEKVTYYKEKEHIIRERDLIETINVIQDWWIKDNTLYSFVRRLALYTKEEEYYIFKFENKQ